MSHLASLRVSGLSAPDSSLPLFINIDCGMIRLSRVGARFSPDDDESPLAARTARQHRLSLNAGAVSWPSSDGFPEGLQEHPSAAAALGTPLPAVYGWVHSSVANGEPVSLKGLIKWLKPTGR